MAYGESPLPFEVMLDCLILSSFQYPFLPSQEELFRVVNCNHIIDVTYLSKLLGVGDLELCNVKYLEISILFSQE